MVKIKSKSIIRTKPFLAKFTFYFSLALNIVLVVIFLMFVKPAFNDDKRTYAYQNLSAHLYRLAKNIDANTVVFLGSSTIQGLHVGQVSSSAMNLGIGGEKLLPLASRIEQYNLLPQAKAAVIMAGFNDVCESEDTVFAHFISFTKKLPANLPIVLVGLQPAVTGRLCADLYVKLNLYNERLQSYCQQHQHCIYADVFFAMQNSNSRDGGSLMNYFEVDGIHFSPEGYRVLVHVIRQALKSLLD